MIIIGTLFAALQSPAETDLNPTRWVVKDVQPATPRTHAGEHYWQTFFPLGDPTDAGIHDMFGDGGETDGVLGFTDRRFWDSYFILQPRQLFWLQGSAADSRFFFSNAYIAPLFSLLKAPDGVRATIVDVNRSPNYSVRDWETGALRGYFDVPPPPNPNWSSLGAFRSLRTAGDVDRDGYDDVLFETIGGGASVVGVMDGRTLQPRWLHGEYPIAVPTAPTYASQGGPFDVNGDGWLDQIHSAVIHDLSHLGTYLQAVSLLSGFDGAVIWRHVVPWNSIGGAVWGGDFDGDQAQDVLVNTTSDWIAYSGSTGTELWRIPPTERASHYNPGYLGEVQTLVAQTIQPSRHVDGPTAFLPVEVLYPSLQGWRRPVMEVRARTGELIGPADFPEDLWPWSLDLLHAKSLRIQVPYYAVGDLDRDGLVELAMRVYAPAYDLPGPGVAMQAAILSPETLTMPAQAPVGSEVIGELWIPNGAGLPFQLLGTTSFDGGGGVRIGGWKTHLGSSPLLTDTLAQPAFTGTLDAAGKARIRVDLSRWPLTPGAVITWKAVIQTASGGDVHTLSTLAQTEILP